MAQLVSVQTASALVSVSAVRTGRLCCFCGQIHAHQREVYPAYDDTCLQCNRRNHWKRYDQKTKIKKQTRKRVPTKRERRKATKHR